MDVRDADTLLVVGELHELIGAPADAVRCLTAALTRRPSHLDTWLRLVHAQSVYTTGSQPRGIPTSRNCIVSGGDWDHKLADSNCSNVDPLADLAEVTPVIF